MQSFSVETQFYRPVTPLRYGQQPKRNSPVKFGPGPKRFKKWRSGLPKDKKYRAIDYAWTGQTEGVC